VSVSPDVLAQFQIPTRITERPALTEREMAVLVGMSGQDGATCSLVPWCPLPDGHEKHEMDMAAVTQPGDRAGLRVLLAGTEGGAR
jgi:hypothetical protein